MPARAPAPETPAPAVEPVPENFTFSGAVLDENWTDDGGIESLDISIGVQRAGGFLDKLFTVPMSEIVERNSEGEDGPESFTISTAYAVESGIMAAIHPETFTICGALAESDDPAFIVLNLAAPEGGEVRQVRISVMRIIEQSRDEESGQDCVTLTRDHALELELVPVPEPEEDAAPEGDRPVLRKHPDLEWLAQEKITVTQQLTEAEKAEYADDMAKLDEEIEALEDERSAVSNRLKKQIDAKEAERRAMSKVVREGNEEREVFCDKCADYDSGEMKWADAVTGEIVNKRPLVGEERQRHLPGVMSSMQKAKEANEAAAEQAPEAPEAGQSESDPEFAAQCEQAFAGSEDAPEAGTVEGVPLDGFIEPAPAAETVNSEAVAQ